jgi:hypothetical protein
MSTLFASCALLLTSAAPALAQPAAEEPATSQTSDDIIVTGEKSDRTIRHTTTSIAVTTPKS